LQEDLLFRCIFVVDPADATKDVELECIDVGNGGLPSGPVEFKFEVEPPKVERLEAAGGVQEVQGIYISALYRNQEFTRIGYYLRHDYDDPAVQEDPPPTTDWSKVHRVLSEPRVTRFDIKWDPPPVQAAASAEVPIIDVSHMSS